MGLKNAEINDASVQFARHQRTALANRAYLAQLALCAQQRGNENQADQLMQTIVEHDVLTQRPQALMGQKIQ